MRTFKNVFDFTIKNLGELIAKEALISQQISLHSINMPEISFSLKALCDFHRKLRLFDTNDDYYIKMGLYNNQSKNNKTQFKQLIEVNSILDVYKASATDLAKKIDQNYFYSVKSIENGIVIVETWPREHLKKHLVNIEYPGLYEVMLYRFGHYLGAPGYFDLPLLPLEKSTFKYDLKKDIAHFFIAYK